MGRRIGRTQTAKSPIRIPIELTIEPFSPVNPHPGVRWDEGRQRWHAQATYKSKNYNLGRYLHYDDAVEAVIEFRDEHPKYS